MKILVLGDDDFCGWPTALHLSAAGHEVLIADNLSRRNIDNELEVQSLTPIRPIGERLRVWCDISGKKIFFARLDIATQYDRLLNLIVEEQPDTIVHFAEQRAAPYSMKSSWHKRYTVNNNLNTTNNLLAAIVESELDIHVVHLGTMGVYGYGTGGPKTPGGLPNHQGRKRRWRTAGTADPLSGKSRQHLPPYKDVRCSVLSILRQE